MMQSDLQNYALGHRASTVEAHSRAIERVIMVMREQLDEPLSLEDLARVAVISPYHFDRIFRQMIGIPPCQFLGALRMEEAKRLLLTTHLRVTDVCLEVGYNSLGTFITRFNQLVGLTPRRLRLLAKDAGAACMASVQNHMDSAPSDNINAEINGNISAPDDFEGVIFIGLFPTPIPQSKPVGCALLKKQGSYSIPLVPDGSYYVLAAGFPWSESSIRHLLTQGDSLYVGIGNDPITIKNGEVNGDLDISLRPLKLTDPPILVALPFLLDETQSGPSEHLNGKHPPPQLGLPDGDVLSV
jgi:AraC-like DNA-binding protein